METPKILASIDWTALRTQKTSLLATIEFLEKNKVPQLPEDLDGILHLIDALQDYAVDEMGVPAIHVFDFEQEENRESGKPMKTADPKDFEQQPGETDEEFFARNNAQSIFWMHIEGTGLYEEEEIPEEFIKSIVDDPVHAANIKDKIRRDILKDVQTNPGNFDRDPEGKLTYDYTMYDYGYATIEYCRDRYYETKTKNLWLCPSCGSDNVELKHWVNPNTNKVGTDCEDEMGFCNDCQLPGELINADVKFWAKVEGFQVVGDEGTAEDGDIHPDMEGSFCLYNLTQARAMLNDPDNGDEQWKLLAIWSGDVEEPTIMFEGDPRD